MKSNWMKCMVPVLSMAAFLLLLSAMTPVPADSGTGDSVKPTVTITSPANGQVLNSADVTVTWQGSDTGTGIARYEVSYGSSSFNVGLNTSHKLSLGDGKYSVSVRAYDGANNSATATVSLTVDTVVPNVQISSPTAGATYSSTSIEVSWTATDATTKVERYVLRLGEGSWQNMGTSKKFQLSLLDQEPGTSKVYTVTVGAYDSADNFGTATVTFTVDLVRPEIVITSPLPGQYLEKGDYTVTWVVTDIGAGGITSFNVSVNGGPGHQVDLQQRSYSGTTTQDGTYTVEVQATDSKGHTFIASTTFIVDTTPPTLSVTAPLNGSILKSSTVQVKWTAADPLSGLAEFKVMVDGLTWYRFETNVWSTTFSLADGWHNITVTAVDNAGLSTTVTVNVLVDTAKPKIEIQSPGGGDLLNRSSVTVKWSAEDAAPAPSGISHFALRVDNGPWYIVDGGSQALQALVSLPEGTHTIEVKAVDKAGNEGTAKITITVDTTPPAITPLLPEIDAMLRDVNVNATWTAVDAVSGVERTLVRMDDGPWLDIRTGTSHLFRYQDVGDHILTISSVDRAGNRAVLTIPFQIDDQPPALTITHPLNNAQLAIHDLTVSWTVSDVGSGLRNITVLVDGVDLFDAGTASQFTIRGLVDGTHTIKVTATDLAGNVDTDEIAVTIDSEPPRVKDYSPSGDSAIFNRPIVVLFSKPMDGGSVQVQVSDGVTGSITWDASGTTATFTPDAPLLYPMTYTVTVSGKDAFGIDMKEVQWTFSTADLSVPGPVTGLEGEAGNGGAVLRWNAPANSGGGALTYKVYRSDGGSYELLGTTSATRYVDRNVSAGATYTYKVVASNPAGDSSLTTAPRAVVSIALLDLPVLAIIAAAVAAAVVGVFLFLRRRRRGQPALPDAAPAFPSSGGPGDPDLSALPLQRLTMSLVRSDVDSADRSAARRARERLYDIWVAAEFEKRPGPPRQGPARGAGGGRA